MRERNITIAPQSAITKDNVSVEVSGNLYVRFTDPEKVRGVATSDEIQCRKRRWSNFFVVRTLINAGTFNMPTSYQ